MGKYIFSMTFLLLLLAECSNQKRQNVERVIVEYEVITDSIYSSLPCLSFYTGKYVVWSDGNLRTPFIHVIDPSLKSEVASMGQIGQGPNELTEPLETRYNGDTIYIRDINGPKQFLLSIDDAIAGLDYIIPLQAKRDNERRVLIDENSFVYYNCWDKLTTPLGFVRDNDTVFFGKYPVEPSVVEDERSLDASIEWYSELGLLYCSARAFPYTALYKMEQDSFVLVTEVSDAINYKFLGEMLKIPTGRKGDYHSCLTKDYLLTLNYDYEKGEVSHKGRDFSKVPHTVYVWNLNGELLKILDLQIPTLGLAGCGHDNMLYALVYGEEWTLVRIDLDKVLCGKK